MKPILQKLLLSLLAPVLLSAAANASAFPVPSTDEAGVTRWGYMGDGGKRITDFLYNSAGEFAQNGLAAVTNDEGKLALIREDGELVTDWLKLPKRVESNGVYHALDYGKYIDYYDADGNLVGSIDNASGFPGDGLVVTSIRANLRTSYGYSALQPIGLAEEPDESPAEPAGASVEAEGAAAASAAGASATGSSAAGTAAGSSTAGSSAAGTATGSSAAGTAAGSSAAGAATGSTAAGTAAGSSAAGTAAGASAETGAAAGTAAGAESGAEAGAAAGTESGAEAESAAEPVKQSWDSGFAIEPTYQAAGEFRKGRALVQTERGAYAIINTRGQVLRELPEGTEPTALDIYADNVVILKLGGKYALYSVDRMQFATSFSYDEILPFDRGTARCRVGNLWGLLAPNGSVVMEPTYPYLSYMGDGVYAARGTDPGAAAVSETGEVLYSTDTFVGGFQTFVHGISWYGGLDGSVVFFNSLGTFSKTFQNVENPQVLTSSVVRVTRDGEECYLDLNTGSTIYQNTRNYELANGLSIRAEVYEKYLGLRKDGTEYGYYVEYPQISGHQNEEVQTRVNDIIRNFFVSGPSGVQDRSLDVTFGFSLEGRVLVVWANGVSGLDTSAVIWNDSIGVDLVTGERYTAYNSLFKSDASFVLSELLPGSAPYYEYPRMDSEGVTFFRNHPAERGAEPYSESIWLSFEQLNAAVNFDGACYQALTLLSESTIFLGKTE